MGICWGAVLSGCASHENAGEAIGKGSLALSNVATDTVTSSSIAITWLTDELATSELEYGLDTSYGRTTPLYGLDTTHRVELDGLSPATTYHVRVKSEDAQGNVAASDDLAVTTLGGSCTPTTCAAQGAACGTIPDGCGGTLDCGSCASDASSANYIHIVNTAPVPANYRAYADDSPWNIRLPDNPQHVDATLTPSLQAYAYNTSSIEWRTPADDYISGCNAPIVRSSTGEVLSGGCGGQGGYPVYLASASDPTVTFVCKPELSAYGCTIHDAPHFSAGDGFTYVGHIPANARPGCTNHETCGDMNLAIIQPDGTSISLYGCNPTRDFQDGDTVGTGGDVCAGAWTSGMVLADIVHDKGRNWSVTSGDNYEAHATHYNEVVPPGATIHHALHMPVSCTLDKSYVFPASSTTWGCNAGVGVPTGTHMFLNLSHAQIDDMVASGTLAATMKPFYYALHDYGGYIIDTAGGGTPSFDAGAGGPSIEDARPWVTNGATNPWIPWFQANGAQLGAVQGGNAVWYFANDFWTPIAPYLQALSTCYADGSCSD
jgi:hypothetical protein